jgi:hypothetical protein
MGNSCDVAFAHGDCDHLLRARAKGEMGIKVATEMAKIEEKPEKYSRDIPPICKDRPQSCRSHDRRKTAEKELLNGA